MTSYRELKVWKESMNLVQEVYRLTSKLPADERYALSDQLRRAVVSIPSNIAEGQGRISTKDFIHFLTIARGSKYEVETQLLICERIGYLTIDDLSKSLSLCESIGKMLNSLINRLS